MAKVNEPVGGLELFDYSDLDSAVRDYVDVLLTKPLAVQAGSLSRLLGREVKSEELT